MKPVCLYIALNDSAVGRFVLFLPKGLFWFIQIKLFSSPFVSMFSISSPFEQPAFCLSLSCLSSALCLTTYYPPLIPPVAQVSRPFHHTALSGQTSSFPLTLLLPLSIHHSLHPRLSPEIITTSLVKISLYLNSWISKAWGCWRSLFNNSQV